MVTEKGIAFIHVAITCAHVESLRDSESEKTLKNIKLMILSLKIRPFVQGPCQTEIPGFY